MNEKSRTAMIKSRMAALEATREILGKCLEQQYSQARTASNLLHRLENAENGTLMRVAKGMHFPPDAEDAMVRLLGVVESFTIDAACRNVVLRVVDGVLNYDPASWQGDDNDRTIEFICNAVEQDLVKSMALYDAWMKAQKGEEGEG